MTITKAGALPAPLTPEDCNLQDFAFMPLDVARLRDSDMAAYQSPEACWAAVLLWAAAWHQVPAASLPDDDRFLAKAAGYGRVVKEWMNVREGALHGWIKCADGRLYHPVVAEKALESWRAKVHHAWKKECDRIRKANKQRESEGRPLLPLPLEPGITSAAIPPESAGIPKESPPPSIGTIETSDGNPLENALKGQGEGQGQGELKPYADDDSSNSGCATLSSLPPNFDDAGFAVPQSAPLPEREDPPESSAPPIAMAVALRKLGVDATFTHPAVLGWVDQQVKPEILQAAVALAREQKGPTAKIPPNYLVPIVEKLLNPPAAPAPGRPVQAAPPAPPRKPQGNEPKGTDESYDEWQARVDAFERAQRGRAA